MRQVANDAHAALLRAVRGVLAGDPEMAALAPDRLDGDGQLPSFVVENLSSESWASITFAGHRHRLDVALRGDAATVRRARDRVTARLSQEELPMKGRCVIECKVVEASTTREEAGELCRLGFELVTLEE